MQLLSKLAHRAVCHRLGSGRAASLLSSASPSAARYITREFRAVADIVNRSGVQSWPLQSELMRRALHTTTVPYRQSDSGDDNGKRNQEDEEKRNKNMQVKAALWMVTAYIVVVLLGLVFPATGPQEPQVRYVSWNEFVHQMLRSGEVDRVLVRPDMNAITVYLHEGAIVKGKKVDQLMYQLNVVDLDRFEEKLREVERNFGLVGSKGVPVEYTRSSDSSSALFTKLLLGIIIFGIIYSLGSNMSLPKMDGFRQMTRAKFTAIDPLLPGSGRGVKFADVAGAKEAKQEVIEFVDFLKNPLKYKLLGAKSPKGALLLGPPGCGKTMLAKAVATEGQVPFLAMNGSEFIEMIGGLGAARVRDLFKEAKKRSPCIIYIDEIDAIGRKRSGTSGGMDGSGESEQTLNQLLVEMDGIGSKEGVVMLASTNRLDMLDEALLRPGRFDRHIMLDLPTQEERQEILEHHLKSIVLEHDPTKYSKRLSSLTLGFSGAELANLVNEAALYAARNVHPKVTGQDLEYAVERVIGGPAKKSSTIGPEERRVVAYHEAGHVLAGWLLEHTDALIKVTIIPRTSQALSFAQYMPTDRKLYTQQQIFERMCMAMGGRVAESVVFNRVTTGAQNDLEKVTRMAYAQVRNFGFSPLVGQVSFPEGDGSGMGRRPYSKALSATIDKEAKRIVFESYKHTETLITHNKDKLKQLAEELLLHETVSAEGLAKLWGPSPFPNKAHIEPDAFETEIQSWVDAGKNAPADGDSQGHRDESEG